MGGLGAPELLIILAVVILLFGPKRIPDLAKGLGEGIRSFKTGIRGEEPKEADRHDKDEQATKR
jgi:sec-independent protein translocase protein TatA